MTFSNAKTEEPEKTGEFNDDVVIFPTSFAQQRLWFLDQCEPNSALYNIPLTLRLRGLLNVFALGQSINECIKRHEILRTCFGVVDGQPIQVIKPAVNLSLPVVEVNHSNEMEHETHLRSVLAQYAQQSFDLRRGPLFRSILFRLTEEDHVLLLNMHHIVSDGWSMGIFFRELAAFYNGFIIGNSQSLPELPIQYADYAIWQREQLHGEVLERQLSYWKKRLEGKLPVLKLPTDRPRPAVLTSRGASQLFALSKELVGSLKALSVSEGGTLFMALFAAFNVLLYRYTGQEDIITGTPIAGRNRMEIEGLIGFFANTLALRVDLSGEPTFRNLLGRVKEVCLGAYEHQDLPFERLVEELNPERDRSYSPLIQVMFALESVPEEELSLVGIEANRMELGAVTAKFEITFSLTESREGLNGTIEYNVDLFDDGTIDRMLGHFRALLEAIAANPDRQIGKLPLLMEAERRQLLVEWNRTEADYPKDATIHELFERQVERTPDVIAVVYEDQRLTYRQLNARANQVAHYLQRHGVGPDLLVGICMERSLEIVIGILGILKASGAYVPLDPAYPKERLAFMLEDTQPSVLLTQQPLIENLAEHSAHVVCLDRDWEEIARESDENFRCGTTADNLAYVMYTSGSSGKPKGVEVLHRGIVRLLFGIGYAQLDACQTFLHLAPCSFDASTFEIWGALLHGAKCVLYPGRVPSTGELGTLLHKHKVTTLWLTASLFNALIDEAPGILAEIHQLLIGGEPLSVSHVRRALALLPHTEIINGYGPTESTTFACCYRIPKQLGEGVASIPIGRPIANTQACILDHYLNPVPVGVAGELHIAGVGLARGYHNQPMRTAESFIDNPLSELPYARLYKTGDLARYLQDGNIDFLGRLDNQVKIRGHRIELGEIETVLGMHPAVRENVVVLREDVLAGRWLVAYIVANQATPPVRAEFGGFLKQKLPDYMIPSHFLFLNSLPLTANGKVDRQALPIPDRILPESEDSFLAPRDEVERKLIDIFAKLLGVQNIGVKDNFFDLGGHSLMAVRVMSRIEKTFGKTLHPATIFQAPTVEQLGVFLREAESRCSCSSLKPIQTKGSNLPFFWIHGEASDAFLPGYLGPDQPIYGLQHQSVNGCPAQYNTVESIAAHYLDEMRTVQSNGPYYLGGYCFGGLVAFDIAQQLKHGYQEVALLVLLEADGPSEFALSVPVNANTSRSSGNDASMGEVMRHYWRKLAARKPKDKFTYILIGSKGKLKERAGRVWEPVKTVIEKGICRLFPILGFRIPVHLRSSYILRIYRAAMKRYVLKVYAGKLILFTSKENYCDSQDWKQFALEGLDIHEVPGGHHDVLHKPYVQFWAKKLRVLLRNAQAAAYPSVTNGICDHKHGLGNKAKACEKPKP
jgi:amino acid adenylation domain-containing protein